MISVAAWAGDARATMAAATASLKNPRADFTGKTIPIRRRRNAFTSGALIRPRAGGFNPQTRTQRTIDDAGGVGKIAISRRLLLKTIEPFFPAIDIIIRG
jgi:hypothetical protein